MEWLGQITMEAHTVDLLLALGLSGQAWIIKKLFDLDAKVKIISGHCKKCALNKDKENL